MTRLPILLYLLFPFILLAGGCSDGNSEAPEVDAAHPSGFIFEHAEEARQDLSSCAFCHGPDFRGVGEAVSCFACHFQGVTAADFFRVHPPSWSNVIIDHQTFAEQLHPDLQQEFTPVGFSWTGCANAACHGNNLRGGELGPSCFLAGCHRNGPPAPASHVVGPGESFFEPENHGPLAQDSLVVCRNCHGRPPSAFDGGFVADPAILGNSTGNCSLAFCHPAAAAHPGEWIQRPGLVSPNDRAPGYVATHADIPLTALPAGCVLCHEVAGAGPSPIETAPPCTRCHPGGFPQVLPVQ